MSFGMIKSNQNKEKKQLRYINTDSFIVPLKTYYF